MKKVSVVLFSLIEVLGLVFSSASSSAQSNNPLVQKPVELFRGVDSTSIDDAVAKAKSQLNAEANQGRRNNLEQLFDSQIATLKDRGVPQQVLETLQNKKSEVINRASKMTIGAGNIPFIPVIKPNYLGYYGLMSLVRNGAKEGYSYLDPSVITDKVETPSGLYYIYDVEDGEVMRGKSPETAEKLLKAERRSPLTAAEAIALATHTNVLSRHFVDASGSRYDSYYVPDLWLSGGRPRLFYSWATYDNSGWGSASCGSR